MTIIYVANLSGRDSPRGYSPNGFWITWTLQELGHTVISVNESDVKAPEVLRLIQTFKPDLILTEEARLFGDFQNAGEHDLLTGEFERVMLDAHVPIVAWLTNIFHGVSRREIQVKTNPIFKADVVFTTDGGHDAEWKKAGVNHVCLRQGIYEPEAYLGEPTYPTTADIVFIGSVYENIWPYRKKLVDWLKDKYGDRFQHLGERGDIRHDDLNNLLATAKIVVGDSVYSPHYWSNRVYEVIGRGGFLIHPVVEGLDAEFTPYKHYIPYHYGDFGGLKEKIDYYLTHEAERREIQLAGFEHAKRYHTYKHRVVKLLHELIDQKVITGYYSAFPNGEPQLDKWSCGLPVSSTNTCGGAHCSQHKKPHYAHHPRESFLEGES